jgi:hypothetical protein
MSDATPLATIHKALAVVGRKAGFRDRVPIRPFISDCVVKETAVIVQRVVRANEWGINPTVTAN